MDWSFVFQILVDVWYVLFVYMIVVIVIGLCCNPDYDDRKHKIRCFVDETLNFFGLVFLCLTFVAVTGVCLTDATLTPSVPVFKKQVISDEKAGTKVPVKQDKIADGSGRKAVVEADGSDVSGGSSGAGTKVPVKQDKIADGSSGKAVVEADGSDISGGSSGAEDISVQQNQNSEYKDFSKKSMTDKIKYAKNHNFTFLYAYEKVNPEDFDYKNSGIVIFEDLKFVLGIPK